MVHPPCRADTAPIAALTLAPNRPCGPDPSCFPMTRSCLTPTSRRAFLKAAALGSAAAAVGPALAAEQALSAPPLAERFRLAAPGWLDRTVPFRLAFLSTP